VNFNNTKTFSFFVRREGDLIRAAQIYTVFTAFGESHTRLLLDAVMEGGTKKDNVLQLVQILLESTSTPGRYHIDENCSHLAFSFWYVLFNFFYEFNRDVPVIFHGSMS